MHTTKVRRFIEIWSFCLWHGEVTLLECRGILCIKMQYVTDMHSFYYSANIQNFHL